MNIQNNKIYCKNKKNIVQYKKEGKILEKKEVKKEYEVVVENNGFDINSEVARNYKDTVFVDLFASDITAGDNIFSLVNALFGSNFDKKKDEYMITRIEGVLYNSLANDIGVTEDSMIFKIIKIL